MIQLNTIDDTPVTRKKLVVIGNGMAGARLLEDVLACDPTLFDITVFGDEPYGNYNRILLSSVLSGSHDPKDIFINPLAWYEENGVRLHAGVPVTAIDRAARVVHGAGGVAEPYDHVVLATGSVPFVPPVEGSPFAKPPVCPLMPASVSALRAA